MGLLDTFKALGAINKAQKFVKEHEDTVARVKKLVENVQKGIKFLEENRDTIQNYIDKAKAVIEKLKGIINK